jgi:hypothetical protein
MEPLLISLTKEQVEFLENSGNAHTQEGDVTYTIPHSFKKKKGMGLNVFEVLVTNGESGEPRTLTNPEEKSRRFDFINGEFMTKYGDLVWLARSDKEKLMQEEIYEGLKNIQRVEEAYPKDVKELYEDDSNWQHGFNSGILAYSRFLASYIEDTLWEVDDDNEDIAENEKVIEINGKKYIEFDGREDAQESFPELDT